MSDTSVEPTKGNLPVTAAEMGFDSGLEDFETTDMVMPRLSIRHEDAVFVDTLTGEEHPKLQVVMLGLIKQRILWDTDVNEGDRPLCKSYNFKEGVPNEATFPLGASGFDELPTAGNTLPCDACSLKEWGSHPQRDTPWCSEQHTFPLLMRAGDEEKFSAPAILTVQRSAIKASKSYLTGFARSNTPVFTVITELSLDPQKKGSVKYAVPRFVKVGPTDRDEWSDYAGNYRQIRSFIQAPPPEQDESATQDASDTPRASNAGASETSAAVADDDDLPF